VTLPVQRSARRLAGTLALVMLLVGAAAADDASFEAPADVKGLDGPGIYGHICQGCHMPNGEGAVGAGHYPKLAGDRALVSWEYAALTVLNGKHDMPAFGLPGDVGFPFGLVQLTDSQVAAVVNYVRSNFGNHYQEVITSKQVASLPHPRPPAP
jgi:mono/diheme cytochrome c family protein